MFLNSYSKVTILFFGNVYTGCPTRRLYNLGNGQHYVWLYTVCVSQLTVDLHPINIPLIKLLRKVRRNGHKSSTESVNWTQKHKLNHILAQINWQMNSYLMKNISVLTCAFVSKYKEVQYTKSFYSIIFIFKDTGQKYTHSKSAKMLKVVKLGLKAKILFLVSFPHDKNMNYFV